MSRIEVRDPAGMHRYNPVMVDGLFTQHPTSPCGRLQKAIDWVHDDTTLLYGELITKGFTGECERVTRWLGEGGFGRVSGVFQAAGRHPYGTWPRPGPRRARRGGG